MSQTPRTDAQESAWRESGIGGEFSPVALCRTLERDLAAANAEIARLREELKRWQDGQNFHMRRAEAAERERAAALKDAERYRWLRDESKRDSSVTLLVQTADLPIGRISAAQVDAAIDAAMGKEK